MSRTTRDHYDTATAHLEPPFAVVDLAAFRANAADLARRASGTPIRVASKSLRCRHLIRAALDLPGYAGIMAFTLPEALWLATDDTHGPLSDDILVAYPTADTGAIARLAADEHTARTITLMVDDTAHLDLITAAAPDPAHPIKVCIDVDTSWQPLGPRLRIGAHRSPLRTPAQAAALARAITHRPNLRLDGIMAYEAQIAGVADAPPGHPLHGRALRWIQARSRTELARRRAAIVRAVRAVADVRFVNGGGTGSAHTTCRERAVTEIGAGSGLYQPALFDDFSAFTGRPAALFALPVVRRPGPGWATALGGGYPASGPAGPAALPRPHLPRGLHYSPTEGPGETQTPLRGAAADHLAIGDRVWMRHAKAGELCERFAELHLIDTVPGDGADGAADAAPRVVATVPTYRGEGRTFL
ncbi:D-serine deaminase-like pyridoxal phosphate-dependent protein [Nocardiopsis mwathae]|uniref:D-serine deaminase-like pyridoxal phosphate-dependent protein n=1 Tax=Nocardiopsis mwathae TaxID=1472723 RepID=A0A7X0D6E1_9ACTN|nr:alanine racemase [Nocardiopsis mwathae]MBB6173165.1 D-serine deaminase-like pyridoxal phosphate-dependent protein [Nocardiopsis mwathae]